MTDPRQQPENLTDAQLADVIGGNAAPTGSSIFNLQNLQSMDIETALMMVQSERTKLLDAQLSTQLQEVQNRNDQVSKLNGALSALNEANSTIKSDGNPNVKFGEGLDSKEAERLMTNLTDAFKKAGVDISEPLKDGLTKGEIESLQTHTKSMIDAAGNSQQMDMLRLQSLSNKRNEAFDVMTNFVKKMQESRSSIIGNMR